MIENRYTWKHLKSGITVLEEFAKDFCGRLDRYYSSERGTWIAENASGLHYVSAYDPSTHCWTIYIVGNISPESATFYDIKFGYNQRLSEQF